MHEHCLKNLLYIIMQGQKNSQELYWAWNLNWNNNLEKMKLLLHTP
jgi:hypothetical protein